MTGLVAKEVLLLESVLNADPEGYFLNGDQTCNTLDDKEAHEVLIEGLCKSFGPRSDARIELDQFFQAA